MRTRTEQIEMLVAAGLDDEAVVETLHVIAAAKNVGGRWLVVWDGDVCDFTNLIEKGN